MATFGERFKQLRNEYDKTLDEMKDVLQTTKSTLSHYENNHRTPKIDFAKKAAEYFNVTVDYIMGESDIKRSNNKEENASTEVKELLSVFNKLTGKEKKYVIEDLRGIQANKAPYYYFILEKDEYEDITDPKMSTTEKLDFISKNNTFENLLSKEPTRIPDNMFLYSLNKDIVDDYLAKKHKPNK